MTFYPQKTGIKKRGIHRTLDKQVVITEVETYYDEVDRLSNEVLAIKLEGARFIQREDEKHDSYHNDEYDAEETHHHLQFPYPIDGSKLNLLLKVLEEYQVLSSAEREMFLAAYEQYKNNVISHNDESPNHDAKEKQDIVIASSNTAEEQVFLQKLATVTERAKKFRPDGFFPSIVSEQSENVLEIQRTPNSFV
ncbi:hypothetical protein Ljam_1043 [Legionella jamestowniensis]|nr:hypothetical protein Ljam_1043 [Legionella jamestowniensis]